MQPQPEACRPTELWAGIECTVNRVGNTYHDQLISSGHASRLGDLDRFAELGVGVLRYPLLWERLRPGRAEDGKWAWADRRLRRLRELGIRPIAGLVHHGSGPRGTSLLESSFAHGLAAYARNFAARYPWIEDYTPVNEPLTTARFSALYGHWYPHGKDALSFARALLNQCRGVVLAMQAVREINSSARLIQTDDLGKTFSTPALAYQAEFENQRRWLTWDLLCGRVDRRHALWDYLRWLGVNEVDVAWFAENPCPPNMIGVNYYVTSERFLDERIESYPAPVHGGNGRQRYADLEAVRARREGAVGVGTLLGEAWERYRLPLAITEVHLGCTREEQMRWLLEIWDAAQAQKNRGVDVRAVTVWALLGSFDWDSLVTRRAGNYEPGVFDLRAPVPRPTALAGMVRDFASGRRPDHPVLAAPCWWHRPERLLRPQGAGRPDDSGVAQAARPLLITGATGTLGRAFARICSQRGLPHRLLSRQELDIADPRSAEENLQRWQPWAVINTAGYVRVDAAEVEPERCYRENTHGPAVLAAACARAMIPLVTFSSDLVFNGRQRSPYRVCDPVGPLNVYGRTKAEAEQRVLELLPEALVVRTSAFFGPWDTHNFVVAVLRALAAGREFIAANDAVISPTYVPDLVHACLDLLIDGENGIWHLANEAEITWVTLARQVAEMAGLDARQVNGCPTCELRLAAPRPLYSVLGSDRATLLPSLNHALERFLEHREVNWTATQTALC